MEKRSHYTDSKHFEIKDSTINDGVRIYYGERGSLGEQDIHMLPCADEAAFNSRIWEHESLCLPDTRVDLLDQIITWSNDSHGACIFWLNGIAGTGKSTIARTVAHRWFDQKQLGASFFFSRGLGDLGHAAKLFTTLAAQLAITLPTIIPYVCKAIKENPDIFRRGLGEQWKHLIFKPLSDLNEVSPRSRDLILVIDALDECESDDDTQLILRLLAEAETLNAIRLRVFLTSRPEIPVRFGFDDISKEAHQDFILHEISPPIIQHDISLFLRHELRIIRKKNRFSEDWPGEERIEYLCERARGLFIYASTACRFIRDVSWDPEESLALLLKDDYVGQSATQELDEMYTMILMRSIVDGIRRKRNQEKLNSEFRQIVGSIVILLDTLSVTMLARLLQIPERTVYVRLRSLHSVLDVPECQEFPVRLLHPSFRDFLLDRDRCLDLQFWVDEKQAHNDLFVSCLKLMTKHLQRDMCKHRLPSAPACNVQEGDLEKCIPFDVRYACRYWVDHLQRSNVEPCDNDQVHNFLQKHFLHWLEALGLMGKMCDSVIILKSLESFLTPKLDVNSDLRMIVYDAKRHILNNRSIFETTPIEIYSYALLFNPRKSRIRCQFSDQIPQQIKNIPAAQENFNTELLTLESISKAVSAVAFLPGGQLLASASCDDTVKLWDSSTGALHSILEGHSTGVNAVAFSPDGKLLASASDKIVRLWNPTTGVSRGILEGHSLGVWSVAFSSDGQLLASVYGDCTVRLWDSSTGAWSSTFEGHSDSVNAVAFSPNDQLLASASVDKTVKLWDPSTGTSRCTLEGHSDSVNAVAFSPNGRLLASASFDKTVRLWDTSTGAPRSTLEGHSNAVTAVAFSPDGQLVTSTSYKTVRLWDPSTGALRSTLEGHSDRVNAVTFSPDGKLLASASSDRTVRLWDPSTGVSRSILEGYSLGVWSVAFSPDGQLLASTYGDCTVRLWDSSTGALRTTREGHSDSVNAVAFLPDDQFLASASFDKTVRLWDPSTATSRCTLEGHSDRVNAVAFSSDAQLLATASDDNTIRLWDVERKETIQVLEIEKPTDELSFSSNGSYLETSQGNIEIQHLTHRESGFQSNSSSCQLSVSRHWVRWGKENILWLPPNLRPTYVAVQHNTLALGHWSGNVTILEFDPKTIHPASDP
ncbi:putative WD-repeat protein [Trichophaea hybrida]|nr:putative WD-repeat protein [Trichophaea hybrida]